VRTAVGECKPQGPQLEVRRPKIDTEGRERVGFLESVSESFPCQPGVLGALHHVRNLRPMIRLIYYAHSELQHATAAHAHGARPPLSFDVAFLDKKAVQCRKETVRCRSCSIPFRVRRQHSQMPRPPKGFPQFSAPRMAPSRPCNVFNCGSLFGKPAPPAPVTFLIVGHFLGNRTHGGSSPKRYL